jgi:hypothetical protein
LPAEPPTSPEISIPSGRTRFLAELNKLIDSFDEGELDPSEFRWRVLLIVGLAIDGPIEAYRTGRINADARIDRLLNLTRED